jgi:hypothetical protein
MRLDQEHSKLLDSEKLVAKLLSASQEDKLARKRAEWRLAETLINTECIVVNANKEKAAQQDQERLRCEQHQQQQQQQDWRLCQVEEQEKANAEQQEQDRVRLEHQVVEQQQVEDKAKADREATEKERREVQKEEERATAAAAASELAEAEVPTVATTPSATASATGTLQSPQNSNYANAWNIDVSPGFSMGNHSREDHIERSMTRNVTGEQRKEKFLDGRNGRLHKGTTLDRRINNQKNNGRKNRDSKVTQKRVAGTAPIGSPTGTYWYRSYRFTFFTSQSPW